MVPRLRAAARLVAILIWTLAAYGLVFATVPLRRPAPRLQLRLRNRIFRTWGRGWCRLAGTRIRTEGTPPTGPFFLVSNHLGYMDIPLLGAFLDGTFVAKADLRRWPLAGHVMHVADTIFIDRGRKRDLVRVDREIERLRAKGLGIILFPEATSGNGADLLPFKGSLLEHASRHRLPVHYATIHYAVPPGSPKPASDSVCWWGDTPIVPHLPELLALPYHEATVRFGAAPVEATDRKALTEGLEAAMREIFSPVA